MTVARAGRFRDAALKHGALATLLMLATQSGGEDTGLSKGAEDPADAGTRCAVMAGREDRAYLDCARQAPKASTSTVTPPDAPRSDQLGVGHEGSGRRYPQRIR